METQIIAGLKTCPSWLKVKYRSACNFTCMNCHKKESIVGTLQIHRIKRGNLGGLYTLVPLNHKDSNVRIICKDCHKKIHRNEWRNIKGK